MQEVCSIVVSFNENLTMTHFMQCISHAQPPFKEGVDKMYYAGKGARDETIIYIYMDYLYAIFSLQAMLELSNKPTSSSFCSTSWSTRDLCRNDVRRSEFTLQAIQ